jgi:hypothetical protein
MRKDESQNASRKKVMTAILTRYGNNERYGSNVGDTSAEIEYKAEGRLGKATRSSLDGDTPQHVQDPLNPYPERSYAE